MADATERLLLQVDASVELLRRHMADGEQPLDRFEKRAAKMASNVDASIAEMGNRFGAFSALAETAATKAQRSFEASFSDIQKIAAKAISGPTSTGGVNAGAADARTAAAAAQQQATALNLIEQAAQRAAAGTGEITAETRLYLQAATAARIAGEQHAAELTREAGELERLEIELNAAGGAQRLLQSGQRAGVASAGQLRSASQQLSYQINDVATSFAGGINPMVIFAQQGSQVVQAISLMKAEAGGFVGFLSGPWGAVILGAISILGVLASKHSSAADAEATQKDAAKSLAEAIKALQDATDSAAQSSQRATFQTLAEAQAKRQLALDTRTATQEQLRLARTKLQGSKADALSATNGMTPEERAGALGAAAGYERQVRALDTKLKANEAELAASQVAFQTAQAPIIQRRVQERNDPSLSASGHAERQADLLYSQLKRGEISEAAYDAKLNQLTVARDGQLKLIQDSKKKDPAKKGPSADTLEKRAEAARVAVLKDDTAYTEEERQARHKLLDATRKTAASEERRDELLREDINAEANAKTTSIRNQLSAGDLGARGSDEAKARAAHLLELNESTRLQRLQNVKIAAAVRVIDRKYEAEQDDLQSRIAVMRISQDLATTDAERRRIGRLILAAEQELRRAALQRVAATSQDPAEVGRAQVQLAKLPQLEDLEKSKLEEDSAGPLQSYIDRLKIASQDTDTALQNIAVNGFGQLEDAGSRAIGGAVTNLLHLKGVAGDVIGSIISDLARLAIEKAIVAAIGGSFGFSGGGSVEQSGADIINGYADGGTPGGMISGPGTGTSDSILAILGGGKGAIRVSTKEFIVNAAATQKHLPLLHAINSGRLPAFAEGGSIEPNMPRFNLRTPRLDMARYSRSQRDQIDVNARVKVDASPLLVATVQQTAIQTVGTAAEPIMAGAQSRTIRTLNRPSLPGGWG